jgi:hypothetical protein
MKLPRKPDERKTASRRHQVMSVSLRGAIGVVLGILSISILFEPASFAADGQAFVVTQAPAVSAAPPTTPSPLEPGTTIAARVEERVSTDPIEWSVSGAIGPVLTSVDSPSSGVWPLSFGTSSTAWQLELQRRRTGEQFVLGVTFEGTYDHAGNGSGQQLFGTNVFVGSDWRHRHFTLEATIGAGLEAAQIRQQYNVSYGSAGTGFVYYPSYQLGLYAQGALAAAVPLTRSIEVLIRVGVHITSSHDEDWFATSTIGLRYTLP